jgi:flagellar biosynthesis anti-sigma factor FlgM
MSPKKKHSGDRPGPPPSRREAGDKARLIEKAREVVNQTPEVRPEKVARLKEAIERGVYEIDAEKLADIILKEWFPKR